MEYGYEETKVEENSAIEVQDCERTEIFQVSSTDAVTNTPEAGSLNDSDNDIEMKTNEPSVDMGVYFLWRNCFAKYRHNKYAGFHC